MMALASFATNPVKKMNSVNCFKAVCSRHSAAAERINAKLMALGGDGLFPGAQ